MKEPDFDSVDNLVDEETSIDIESDAIEDAPVIAPVPAVDSVPDPAVEEPAVEPTVDDPLAVDPAVDDPVEDDPVVDYPVVHPVIIIDDMDYEDTDDNMAEMVVEEINLYEDGVNIHDKEDYEKPEHGKNETAEKPDHGMHDKPMDHSDDDWRYPEDEYHYASSTSTIALSIPAFILTMFNK